MGASPEDKVQNKASSDPEGRPGRIRWLSGWERAAAAGIGIASVGAGGLGVFVSSNQAGTTALLLIGSLFLLLGIQGTPIRSATKDSVQLERRLVDEANSLVERGKAEAAIPVLEAVKASNPEVADSPRMRRVEDLAYQSVEYEEAVADALWRLLAEDLHAIYRPVDGPWDIVILNRANEEAARVLIKYLPSRHPNPSSAMNAFYRDLEQDRRSSIPTIGVVNLSSSRFSISMTGAQVVVWHDRDDDERFAKALEQAGLHLQ